MNKRIIEIDVQLKDREIDGIISNMTFCLSITKNIGIYLDFSVKSKNDLLFDDLLDWLTDDFYEFQENIADYINGEKSLILEKDRKKFNKFEKRVYKIFDFIEKTIIDIYDNKELKKMFEQNV